MGTAKVKATLDPEHVTAQLARIDEEMKHLRESTTRERKLNEQTEENVKNLVEGFGELRDQLEAAVRPIEKLRTADAILQAKLKLGCDVATLIASFHKANPMLRIKSVSFYELNHTVNPTFDIVVR